MTLKRVLVVNGPNLNLLGSRQPDVYGKTTLAELDEKVGVWGADLGLEVESVQSNHEGVIIDRLHEASGQFDGVVINAGAFTHYSYAIHDALEAISLPAVEVHISNIKAREDWRRHSVVSPACVATIYGRGIFGYRWALRHLLFRDAWPPLTYVYGEGTDHVGDLRVPTRDGTEGVAPVIVLLHGGFWRGPWTRDLMDGLAVDLARRGWATWNLEYQRVGAGGGWPQTLSDVGAGIDALADLTEDYPLDLERVIVLGHSSGGQLALWSAVRVGLAHDASEPRVTPRAIAALAAMSDLAEAHRLGLDQGAVEAFLRRSPESGPERYAAASPTELLPLGIRQLIIHGDKDNGVPVEMSRTYAGAAADAGDSIVYHELEGMGHFSLILPESAAWGRIADELAELI